MNLERFDTDSIKYNNLEPSVLCSGSIRRQLTVAYSWSQLRRPEILLSFHRPHGRLAAPSVTVSATL